MQNALKSETWGTLCFISDFTTVWCLDFWIGDAEPVVHDFIWQFNKTFFA
jgi:hypothetical protein